MKTKLSITSAAVAFGVSRETIRKALARTGEKIGDGVTFTVRQIHLALAGDTKFERARLIRAQAEKAERENKKVAGELVDGHELQQQMMDEIILPLKNALWESARKNGYEKHLVKVLEEIKKEFDLKGLLK